MFHLIKRYRKFGLIVLMLVLIGMVSGIVLNRTIVRAAGVTATPQGYLYSFSKDSEYEISTSGGSKINGNNTIGVFSVEGEFNDITAGNGKPSYDITDGTVSMFYSFDKSVLNRPDTEWHLYEDGKKTVDGISLSEKINNGVIIVQSSFDGNKWTTDDVKCNAFTKDNDFSKAIYETKEFQQINGCFFRVIVAYEMEITKSTTTYVGFIPVDDKDYKKVAEVYEFYIVDTAEQAASTVDISSRKMNLGGKVNTGKDNGYSGDEGIGNKDPHLGWDIGKFYVNGYTGDMKDPENPNNTVFLKNVGDKVTLWFDLTQDIDKLNGNEKLNIHEDTNGYDKKFDVSQTNFKRGTLLIRFLDRERKPQRTIIYTDFLSACSTTSADTRVILFEEGDYEVALDYEICKHDLVDSYTNYQIYFTFSIRNSNCMVYPFDVVTGAELTDKAITSNGFRLDLANSKYLDLHVKRTVLQNGAGGRTEDVRFNRAAKDGEEFKDDGIYTITVKNIYTGIETIKTIYVGTDQFLKALSTTGLSVKEIESRLDAGATIASNGKLLDPTPTPTPSPTATPTLKPTIMEESVVTEVGAEMEGRETDASTSTVAPTPTTEPSATPVPTIEENAEATTEVLAEQDNDELRDSENRKGKSNTGFVIFGIVAAGAIIFLINRKSKLKMGDASGDRQNSDEE